MLINTDIILFWLQSINNLDIYLSLYVRIFKHFLNY